MEVTNYESEDRVFGTDKAICQCMTFLALVFFWGGGMGTEQGRGKPRRLFTKAGKSLQPEQDPVGPGQSGQKSPAPWTLRTGDAQKR